jgi:iron(III) transport system substrate-binding protein
MSFSRHSLRPLWLLTVVALAAACSTGARPSGSAGTGASGSPSGTVPGISGSPSGASASPGTTAKIGGTLTVYSGRSEDLVAPAIESFRKATGVDVKVRYGDSAELAATILEEGANSPADVFFSQDAGALGALSAAGRLGAIRPELLERIEAQFRSTKGEWVGVTGRGRVLAYDPRAVKEADLPASVLELTDPKWKDKVGWAPTNASFQAFVTALRKTQGEDVARKWLTDMKANGARTYEGNGPIVVAIDAGELPVGLVNHYYVLEEEAELGRPLNAKTHFFSGGDPGSLVNAAGVGVLKGAKNTEAADAFVDYMLSRDAQSYFASQTFEYPLIADVPADARLVPLKDIAAPRIDLSALADLQATLELLRDTGVL